jgi:hypothetical protein
VATAVTLLAAATIGCAATPTTPPAAVQAALEDAARVTGLAVTKLKVAGIENVTWLDSSLGCPDPDLMYTQALVTGYRIRIEAGDQILDYHADTRGNVLLCPPERAVPPAADLRPNP